MSSLNANLFRGTAGLIAQSKGLEVTGRNLANVNTLGYARQRVDLSSGATVRGRMGPESMGVRVDGVSQARSIYLDRQVQTEKSLSAGLAAKEEIYSRVQTALGQTIDTGSGASGVGGVAAPSRGISGGLDEFFTDWQEFAAVPGDNTAKNGIIHSATTLIEKFNTADQSLATVQTDLTEKIGADVNTVNGLLRDIAGFNEKISRLESNAPGSALDLRDQRQAKLEQLSGYMNFETRPSSGGNGQIEVFARDTGGGEVPLVDKQIVLTSVSFTGTAFQAGSPPADLSLSTGTLNTQLEARDGFAQAVRNDLATLANQVRLAVNAAYNPGGTGQDFFAPGSGGKLIALAPGMTASTLTATATGDAGANELANAVASVASQRFSVGGGDLIDGTLGSSFGATVSRVGDSLKTVESQLQDQQLTEHLALSLRDQVSGVSLDEETANLMNYQRAFQASARFITTVDSLLDTVVNQMGR